MYIWVYGFTKKKRIGHGKEEWMDKEMII